MKITTIIVTYERLKLNKLAVESHHDTTPRDGSAHLMVVDNGSTDGTQEWLKEAKAAGLVDSLILNDQNEFLGPAWNSARDTAPSDTDYLGKVDNDYYFHPGWYENMMDVIRVTNAQMIIVAADGILQQEMRQYPQYAAKVDGVSYVQGPHNDQGGSYYMDYEFLQEHDIRMKQRKHMTNFTNGHMVEDFCAHNGCIVRLAKPYLTREFERYSDPTMRKYYAETFKARNRMNDLALWQYTEIHAEEDLRGDKPHKIGGCYI